MGRMLNDLAARWRGQSPPLKLLPAVMTALLKKARAKALKKRFRAICSRLSEIAIVLVRFDHIARLVINVLPNGEDHQRG